MTTRFCCAACQRVKIITSQNLSWCVECAELICNACAAFHERFRATSEHRLLEVSEKEAVKKTQFIISHSCKAHPNEQISHLCRDHDMLCCKACVISNHAKCKDVKETDLLGNHMKSELNSKDLFKWLRKVENEIKTLRFSLENTKTDLQKGKLSLLNDIKNRREQIIAIFDQLELDLIADFDAKAKTIEENLKQDTQVLDKAKVEMKTFDTILTVNKDMATNTQFFMANREVDKQQKELDETIKKLFRQRMKKMYWTLDPLMSDIETVVKKHQNAIQVDELPHSAESFKVLIEANKETQAFYTVVEYLEDNRLLVLNKSPSVLKLLDNDLKQICQISVCAKQFVAVSKDWVVVCLHVNAESKQLRFYKLSGTTLTSNGEMSIDLNCFFMAKFRNAAVLVCSNQPDEQFGLSEITFKLLNMDKTITSFTFDAKDKISPWRGLVYDPCSERFIAISKDGLSLLFTDKSGNAIDEKKIDNIGRGGLSGLAVDIWGRVYTADTRKIFKLTKMGEVSHTFDASINVYSIAVNKKGDRLIAVGHNNATEVFTLSRFD